ncbi:ribosomal protein S18-alanine N-acetyltransferase [Vagococcus elongatus]|nr:ribosomal protein S18-alanine N-acetyltransferase [Vagococcus elongatus]
MKDKREYLPQELSELLWQFSEKAYEGGSPWTQDQFLESILHPYHEFLLFEQENHKSLLGYLQYQKIFDEAELLNIAVSKDYRRKQIAEKMLKAFIDICLEEQVTSIYLEVRKSNQAAVNLYEKMNFKLINVRKNYYRQPQEDGLIMQKFLK